MVKSIIYKLVWKRYALLNVKIFKQEPNKVIKKGEFLKKCLE